MPKKTNKEYRNDEDILLRKHHDFMDRSRIKLANSFDKYLLTFATGSLYLSINFSGNKNFLINKDLLAFGWFALMVSMASTLTSIFSSIKAHEKEMDYDVVDINNVQNNTPRTIRVNLWSRATDVCTFIGIASFLLGVALLSIMYFQNINVNKFPYYGRR